VTTFNFYSCKSRISNFTWNSYLYFIHKGLYKCCKWK